MSGTAEAMEGGLFKTGKWKGAFLPPEKVVGLRLRTRLLETTKIVVIESSVSVIAVSLFTSLGFPLHTE